MTEYARLWYHSIAKHTQYDLAHALANQVKDTIRYMMVHTPFLILVSCYCDAILSY